MKIFIMANTARTTAVVICSPETKVIVSLAHLADSCHLCLFSMCVSFVSTPQPPISSCFLVNHLSLRTTELMFSYISQSGFFSNVIGLARTFFAARLH